MASLGLKLLYLRTREKKISQRDLAEQLGIRQATISHFERGVSAPHWALILELCRFFDVSPTFLADEERGVVPHITERWGLRNSLLTLGMWVEVPPDEAHELDSGALLCHLAPGAAFYDPEAAAIAEDLRDPDAVSTTLRERRKAQAEAEIALEAELEAELESHSRRRGK